MALTNGTRLGLYEVVAAIGAGGMGEVYRARDTKLGRSVAVKVLPDALASDADRIARFEREAKALAALNHPHIAALYGMEESDGRHVLVMELVEGETLAERLKRGPMPVGEALQIALQIAEALEAAHEKGIVHRDLKPANVKITPDANVKVLDFGLAKALETERSASELTQSPTLSLMATEAGLILGTAAYMSPEQAKGFPADQRSDVFSFGVVLYEMLTGRQPFHGETAPDILASVLVRDPDLKSLPPNLNPRLYDLLRRCLEKQPKRRWQAIGDVRAEIETIAADPHASTIAQVVAPPRPLWRRATPVVATAIAVGALASAATWFLKPSAPRPVTRFALMLPEGQTFTSSTRHVVAASSDGAQIAYVAASRLYVRSLSELDPKVIQGADPQGLMEPAFSPDGQWIVFYAIGDRTLKRIPVTGGAPVTLCTADPPYGVKWTPDGVVFGQGPKGIMRVSRDGGTPEVLATVKENEFADGAQVLPGGSHVLFAIATGTALDRWDKARIVVQSLKSGERKMLVDGGSEPRYLPTGHLMYAVGGRLLAAPLDLARLALTGTTVQVVEGVRRSPGATTGAAQFDLSATGSLVYVPGPATISSGLTAIGLSDRKGNLQSLKLPPGPYQAPRVSPDGKRIVFDSDDGKTAIVWRYDLSGSSALQRLTFGGNNRFPIWSPNGAHIAFQSDRDGDLAIFSQPADGTGVAERLTKADPGTSHTPESWSPNGEVLLFTITRGARVSLWMLSLRDRKTTAFSSVHADIPTTAVFSPDGRWVAYGSDESGRITIYVEPFPPTGAKFELFARPSDSPHHPLWSVDGKELFYNPRPGGFESVSVSVRPEFAFGNPVAVPRPLSMAAPSARRPIDLTPDGKFVGIISAGETPGTTTVQELRVVLNWFEDLKQRVPLGR